uniref:Peptidase M14 domain-containing protein n=1 Tax=Timema douglasi TaxID=61478 RepID=A0A7R8Z2Q4_TIMDO|nr:unnamed protein product [Timema douglasi]
MWRKTRSRGSLLCHGADPNRNWGYKWRTGGSSSNQCTDTYAGASAFSEIETRTIANYVTSIASELKIYLSIHSFSQLLLLPYGVRTSVPSNYNTLLDIGQKTADALAVRYGTRYTVGNIVDLLYVASGSSVDWAMGVHGIPIAFVYELRDLGQHGFILPADQIIPSGEETLDSLVTLITEAQKTF